MINSKTLNEVLKDPKKALFLSKSKINLTFCDIETIDDVPKTFLNIDKLHLSHNKIFSLNGVQQFKNITHLSLSYNQIPKWDELLKVCNKDALVELNIKGNPFTAHPNHLFLIIERFPKLQRIDDLKISKEDRFYLKNYWLLSGKILPFYIQLKRDLDLIEESLQRMKLTAEIRGREKMKSTQDRRENLEKLEALYKKMTQDLKSEQFLAEVHRMLEKYGRFQSQSPTLSLRILDTMIQGLYDNRLDHLVFDRKTLYVSYRKFFNDLMLKYFNIHDTSFDRFLTQQVLDNPSSYDHWKFAEDSDYAFDCVLFEFYKLMPNQASISHTLNFTFNEEDENTSKKWENPREKVITSLDVEADDPNFLRNLCITHFPVFPLNLQYNNMIIKTLLSQLEVIENVAIDVYRLLGANSPVLKNLGTYKIFLEARLQQDERFRSQTPPDRNQHEMYADNPSGFHSNRLANSLTPGKGGLPSPGYRGASGAKSPGHKGFSNAKPKYLVPETKEMANSPIVKSTKSRGQSPPERYGEHKESQTDYQTARKKKNALPLLLLIRFGGDKRANLKESFSKLKLHAQSQETVVRKRILKEFHQRIRGKLDRKIKSRVWKAWKQRTELKNILREYQAEIRHRLREKYFRLFKIGCVKSQEETEMYYGKNLALKVFYSILNLRIKKRALLKNIIEKVTEKKLRIMKLHLSKWRLVNSAMKYASKKAGLSSKSLSLLTTKRKRLGSEDNSRRYKDLREESWRLQSKKTLRELEPYFTKDRDIFRKCFACDYDV